MKKYIEIRKNEYYDSVTLMSLSAQIKKREIGKYRLCTPEKCTHRIETRTVPERGRRT